MFDARTIREGMGVRTADGRRLGRVERLEERSFVVEKGLAFTRSMAARYADVARVEGGEVVLAPDAALVREGDSAGAVGEAAPVMTAPRAVGHAPPDVIERRAEGALDPKVTRETMRVGEGAAQERAVGIADDGRVRTWTSERPVTRSRSEERAAAGGGDGEEPAGAAGDGRLEEPVRGDPS